MVKKISAAIQKNPKGVQYMNSPGFRLACKDIGIKYTVSSIMEFLEVV